MARVRILDSLVFSLRPTVRAILDDSSAGDPNLFCEAADRCLGSSQTNSVLKKYPRRRWTGWAGQG
jgi:hypothetical protein